MTQHYICKGECNGVSDHPGNCQGEGCSLKGQPLVECNCEDGMHTAAKKDQKEEN